MSRVSGLIGVVFALAYTAGLFLDNGPSQDLSDAKTTAWYASHSMSQWLLSFALVALAGVCAILFAVVLSQRITAADDRSAAARIVPAAGTAAAAVVFAGAALYGTIPAQHLFNRATLPTPAASRIMLGTAYAAVVLVAPLAFGLMMAAVSVLALRHGSLPRWLAILGFPLAALQLANAVAPMIALVLWSLLVGITLTLRKTTPSIITPAPAPALA
jgi:uncharacterized protein DUF4386